MNVKQLKERLAAFSDDTEVRVDTLLMPYDPKFNAVVGVEMGKTWNDGLILKSTKERVYCGDKDCAICFKDWLQLTGGKESPDKIRNIALIKLASHKIA